jgi:hypothetical protein
MIPAVGNSYSDLETIMLGDLLSLPVRCLIQFE